LIVFHIYITHNSYEETVDTRFMSEKEPFIQKLCYCFPALYEKLSPAFVQLILSSMNTSSLETSRVYLEGETIKVHVNAGMYQTATVVKHLQNLYV